MKIHQQPLLVFSTEKRSLQQPTDSLIPPKTQARLEMGDIDQGELWVRMQRFQAMMSPIWINYGSTTACIEHFMLDIEHQCEQSLGSVWNTVQQNPMISWINMD